MPWRPYVVANIYGKERVMRYKKTYATKEAAINAIKKGNKEWMELNYDKNYVKQANFRYGAVEVGKSGYKYLKGAKGNEQLLQDINNELRNDIKQTSRFMFGL
jgi:hypothetical protein